MKPISFLVGAVAAMAALGAVSAMAQGQGGQRGEMCCGKMDTPGWALMSADERAAHRSKVASLKSYDECMQYVEEHHARMGERADQQGVTLRQPRHSICDRLKARGQIN